MQARFHPRPTAVIDAHRPENRPVSGLKQSGQGETGLSVPPWAHDDLVGTRLARSAAKRSPRQGPAPSRATQREEQLGARGGELEVGLDHLSCRVRGGDLRVAQLDHAAGPVLIAPFRERQALARGNQRPSRRDERCLRRANGEHGLVHVDAHLLPQHVQLRGGKGEVALCLVHPSIRQPALEQVPGEGDSPGDVPARVVRAGFRGLDERPLKGDGGTVRAACGLDQELLRLDLLRRGGDLRPRRQRLLEERVERSVFVGLRREPVAGDVVIDGRLQTHGLVQEHLGSLVRVDRIDDRHLREGVVRLRLRQVDGRPCARLHESPDLRAVIVLIGQRLARDREELLEGDRVEEGGADLEEGLLEGDALLIRRGAGTGLRRAPEVAGLPEVPDELRKRHGVREVTDVGPRSGQARAGGYARTEEEVVGRPFQTRGGGQLREQSGARLLDAALCRLGGPARGAELRLPLLGHALCLRESEHAPRRRLGEEDGEERDHPAVTAWTCMPSVTLLGGVVMTCSPPERPATRSIVLPLSGPGVTATSCTFPLPSTTATCTPRESEITALDGTRTTLCETATSSETSTYIPDRSSPFGFGRSTSVRSVRDAGSSAPADRTMRPLKTRPRKFLTVTFASAPSWMLGANVCGTSTNALMGSVLAISNSAVAVVPAPAFTNVPTSTTRRVITPSYGAYTFPNATICSSCCTLARWALTVALAAFTLASQTFAWVCAWSFSCAEMSNLTKSSCSRRAVM